MIAKDLREALWPFLAMALLVLLSVPFTTPIETTAFDVESEGMRYAVYELYEYYSRGGLPLVLLAALLGAGSISSEVSRSTIFLLLSKPVGRARVLLNKYTACAATLLMATIFGHALLLATAAKSYSLEEISLTGVLIATVLLWLGSLFVLGVALLLSIILRSALAAFIATLISVYLLLFIMPQLLVAALPRQLKVWPFYDPEMPEFEQGALGSALPEKLMLSNYWTDPGLYTGNTLAGTSLLVCLVSALPPLLAALWLFNRKAY